MEVVGSLDTYVDFFRHYPIQEVWVLLLLTLARIVPIIALTPFLGGTVLPDPMKLGFSVALAPIFFPFILVHSSGALPNSIDILFMALLVKEVLIGALLGFLISIPYYFCQSAGVLIDHQSGGQSLQVTDPSTQSQASPTGLLYNNMMLVIFFAIGGHLLFFEAVANSYKLVPVDQFLSASFFSHTTPLWHFLIKLLTTFTTIAVQLAAPSLIALLMSDLFLGIANRMAPQVQISFLMWSFKSYVGIALLWAGWWFILKQIEVQGLDWIKIVTHLVEGFH